MKFPIIVIGYGKFVQTRKLFFYEIAGLGCLPVFTEPTMAMLFIASVNARMSDMLMGKPPLTALTCAKKQNFLDILQVTAAMIPDVQIVELNPSPLTDIYREKLKQNNITAESEKYDIAHLIAMLQSEESNTL